VPEPEYLFLGRILATYLQLVENDSGKGFPDDAQKGYSGTAVAIAPVRAIQVSSIAVMGTATVI